MGGALALVLNSATVQTKLGEFLANRLTSKYGLEIKIDRLEIDFLNTLSLKGFIAYDRLGDTLIYVEEFDVKSKRIIPRLSEYRFAEITLNRAQVFLSVIDSSGQTNAGFKAFDNQDNKLAKDEGLNALFSSGQFVKSDQVYLNDCQFSYTNPFSKVKENGIDFGRLELSEISSHISAFRFDSDSLTCHIEALSVHEKSGFKLNNFRAQTKIDQSGIYTSNLQLITPQTLIIGDIDLIHNSWHDYSNFSDSVQWRADIGESEIAFADIGQFASPLHNNPLVLRMSGKVRGTIEELKGRKMELEMLESTRLSGSFDISGLSDIENAFLDFRISNFRTNKTDVEAAIQAFDATGAVGKKKLLYLEKGGDLYFRGAFTGFSSDFVAYGDLQTRQGVLSVDVKVATDSTATRSRFTGSVQTANFDIGDYTGVVGLENVSGNIQVNAVASDRFEEAIIDGLISDLTYRGYHYRDFMVDGTLAPQKFIGNVVSRDPNVNLDFTGIVDFSSSEPILDFRADVYNLDASALNWVNLREEVSVSTSLTLNSRGRNLNDISGKLQATDTYVCVGDSVLALTNLKLTAAGDTSNRKISLLSDIADFNMTGAFNLEVLIRDFKGISGLVFSSLVDSVPVPTGSNFQFSMNYKQSNALSGMLVDELYIAPGTTAYGEFNSENHSFGMFLRSNLFQFNGIRAEGVVLDVALADSSIDAHIDSKKIERDNLRFENFRFEAEGRVDSVDLNLAWYNSDLSSSGRISGQITDAGSSHFDFLLKPSQVALEGDTWEIENQSVVQVDSTQLYIEGISVRNQGQVLELSGLISEDPADELSFKLADFELASVDSLGFSNLHPSGTVHISGTLADAYNERKIFAELEVNDLKLGDTDFGDLRASSRYFGDENQVALLANLNRRGTDIAQFEGSYQFQSENQLFGKLSLNALNLELLNAFEIPEVTSYSGFANGEIYVSGQVSSPALEGYIDFDQAKFKVEYLNTHFTFSDQVRVEDGWFGIDYKPISDELGHRGYVVASAFHDGFKDWTYDINVDAENFLLLNTTRDDNSTYFGTAFGTGTIQFGGYDEFLEINIDATTEKGTSIKLPLDESSDVTMENFVYFINPDSSNVEEREIDLQGVQMHLNVDATPDAEIQIIFDEQTGDIIRGQGSGRITLEIDPTGEFLMFGRYEIEEGDYLFTLKNLVNKQFELRKGGVIGWYGDPYQADINLSASYKVRTSLYPIMIENRDQYRGRENVNVVLNLQDKLMNPLINFDIELPQATETERSQLASVINTTQQLNQQVFSLLILNRFLPIDQAQEEQSSVTVTGVGGFGSTTTSDFVSTQISSWLSEISNEFDIGVNYRPGDQISNQEIAVALSTQLFNERLYVSGNFGVTSSTEAQYSQGQSGILGDFLVEYSITEEGKIRLKVFNETNPYEVFSTSSSIYTQGVGLVYQEDFDTLDEFFDEVKELFTRDEVKKAEKEKRKAQQKEENL